MKLADIKASVKHSVLVSLERAIYDASAIVEQEELCERVSNIIVGIYSTDDIESPCEAKTPTAD